MQPRLWRVLVPVATLAAGLLFATSATTAVGTDLRSDRRLELTDLVAEREERLVDAGADAVALREEVSEEQDAASRRSEQVAAVSERVDELAPRAGLAPVEGPAVTVTLDDAPRSGAGEELPQGAVPDDLVVHEQDVQAVVNALRAGGAEALTVMGERLTSTSAVRCVGNTLLLHGRVYSPPFVVQAVGDPAAMRTALAASPGVQTFLAYVDAYGLGYALSESDTARLPGYDGPLVLPTVERGAR